MSFNPFDEIIERLGRIESHLNSTIVNNTPAPAIGKPITTEELCEFLGLSKPTIIRWKKKGKLPFIQIGGSVRFDKVAVLKALEKSSKSKT